MDIRSSKAASILAAACALVLVGTGAVTAGTCDFEYGQGHNGQAIGSSITGLTFSTTSGGSVFYADITTGAYNVTSDNGSVYEQGEYFVSGRGAGGIYGQDDTAKISFDRGGASFFGIGYSSQYDFYLEAYNSSNTLIDSMMGAANTRSHGGTGLGYLTVSSTQNDMAYVLMRGYGGYWMIDNLSTNVSLPEPSSIMALLCGLGGAACAMRRKRMI